MGKKFKNMSGIVEVFTTKIYVVIFWVKAAYRLIGEYQSFRGTCSLHLQGRKVIVTYTMKMKTAGSFETAIICVAARCNSPEHHILNQSGKSVLGKDLNP
jgi:hypothetical protein